MFSRRVVTDLAGIAATGIEVTISGKREAVDTARSALADPAAHPNLRFDSDSGA